MLPECWIGPVADRLRRLPSQAASQVPALCHCGHETDEAEEAAERPQERLELHALVGDPMCFLAGCLLKERPGQGLGFRVYRV